MLSGTPSVSLGDSTAASPRHRSVVLTSTDSDRRSRSASADQPPRRLHHNPYSSTNGDSNDNGGSRSPPRDASTDVPPVGRTNAPRRRGGRSQAVKTKSEGIAVTARHLERLLAAAPSSQGGASTCPAGFAFTVYSGDFTQHYHIPSEGVQITRGAIKYVDHHQRYGVQTRFRFQLCHNHLQGKCPKAGECSYIHATHLPAPTQVHLNPFAPRRLAADRHGRSNEVVSMVQDDPAVVASYEKLPPGYMLEVYPPNANTTAVCRHPGGRQMIPSDSIFRTVGAESALQVVASGQRGNSSAIGARPRHCAHYQFKRVCNLGSQCHFIHAAVPFDAPTPSSGAAVAAEQHQQPPHHVDAGHDSSNSTPPLTMHVVPPTSTSSANNSQPSRGPTPDEGSGAHQRDAFLAGMQYAMQLMRTAASASPVISPFQSGWSALEAFGTYVTPAQIPVQSPPSVGASPFVTGLAAQRLAAAGIAAPPSGPLGAVPKAAQQPSPQQRRSSAGMAR